jgi:Ca2+-binding RTX toxin-like protein
MDFSNALSLSVGSSLSGSISTLGEEDLFRLDLRAGGSYEFTTSLTGLTDSVLALYDSNGNFIESNDDYGSLASRIEFNPAVSGTYYLGVRAYGNYYTGSYSVAATGSVDNDAPELTGTQAVFPSVTAGSSITITAQQLLAGFTDDNGDTLSIQNLNASSGTLINNNNGTWTFQAPSSGQATLTYTVWDGSEGVAASNSIATVPVVTPTISVTKLGTGHSVEDGSSAQISISLNAPISAGQSFTVTLTSSDTTEGGFLSNGTIGATKVLTFNSSNWSTPQIVNVTGVQDYLNDGDTGYTISVRATNSATAPASNYGTAIRNLNTTINLINDGDTTATGADRDVQVYLVGDEGRPQMDNLVGNDGADRLYGGYMGDELSGGIGGDRLYGGYDDDYLYGGAGDDQLFGEQDDDYLNGGDGADRLDGGSGADTLIGGAGNDVYYVTLNDDGQVEDTIFETADTGGAGIDTVYIPFQVESYSAATGIENIRMNAGWSNTTIIGNTSNNSVVGNAGNNRVDGGSGNDTVDGGAGNDNLIGGVGNDAVVGGDGNDVLQGGSGRDVLTGGAGNDTFDFNLATETGTTTTLADLIQSFVRGQDRIDLSGIDANASLTGNQAFTGTLIGATTTFTVAGQLRFSNGYLYGNTDTDSSAEFVIQITGVTSLASSDFVL